MDVSTESWLALLYMAGAAAAQLTILSTLTLPFLLRRERAPEPGARIAARARATGSAPRRRPLIRRPSLGGATASSPSAG